MKTKDIPLSQLFAALADPIRLRLLNLMADREICVCFLVCGLRMSQPKISRHLAYLRRVGLVASRREGKWMHYRLVLPREEGVAAILREILRQLRAKPQMQRDLERLTAACCAPEQFNLPSQVPEPAHLEI